MSVRQQPNRAPADARFDAGATTRGARREFVDSRWKTDRERTARLRYNGVWTWGFGRHVLEHGRPPARHSTPFSLRRYPSWGFRRAPTGKLAARPTMRFERGVARAWCKGPSRFACQFSLQGEPVSSNRLQKRRESLAALPPGAMPTALRGHVFSLEACVAERIGRGGGARCRDVRIRQHLTTATLSEFDASQGAGRTISGYDILPRIQGHAHAKPTSASSVESWAWHPARDSSLPPQSFAAPAGGWRIEERRPHEPALKRWAIPDFPTRAKDLATTWRAPLPRGLISRRGRCRVGRRWSADRGTRATTRRRRSCGPFFGTIPDRGRGG